MKVMILASVLIVTISLVLLYALLKTAHDADLRAGYLDE